MSSTRFKKDKEIIADYETQVKGAVCVCVCVCVSALCALSLQRLTLTDPEPRFFISLLLFAFFIVICVFWCNPPVVVC